MINDPLIGHHLANFRIDQLLGRGGMARVYLGWDERLERPVAVKVMDELYRENPTYNERFLREARAMASWHHPNIVQVHSAGQEDGIAYFVMEYIRGHDLSQAIREYASQGLLLPYTEVIRIGRAVAKALDYAHARGVIHRDVKPSNVLMADDGRILLTDFGLAMNVAEGTMGEVFGSPQYIAPEQARSSAQAVPQSDLYALGVMLYELLVGQVPFNDPFPATLALQHINETVPIPTRLNPSLPAAADAVLLKSLAKAPSERYQNGSELIDSLERALQSDLDTPAATMPMPRAQGLAEPVAAPTPPQLPGYAPSRRTARPPVPPPPARAARRSYGGWLGGCFLLLLLGVAGIVAAFAFINNQVEPPLVSQPTETTSPTDEATAPVEQPTEIPPTETLPLPTETVPLPTETIAPLPPTATVAPTNTVQPSPTPVIWRLEIVKFQDQGIFITNRTQEAFPLELLRFRSRDVQLIGRVWELDELNNDECVAIWRQKPKKNAPNELDCDLVGKELDFTVPERIWEQPFDVYFDDRRLGTCRFQNDRCEFEFVTPRS